MDACKCGRPFCGNGIGIDPNKDKKPVKTGDATAAAGWMLAVTAAGAVVLVRKRNS